MATEVSSLARMLTGYGEEGEGQREQELVTRDLLGGAAEVDLDLQVPAGWERHLDLSTGKTYIQKRESEPAPRLLHDLNLPPPSPSVGQKLEYQSVCTLEKVKSALERESRLLPRPDASPSPPPSSSSASSSASASFLSRRWTVEQAQDGVASTGPATMMAMAVAVCPACLLYVLVSEVDPRCPRCTAHVPVNVPHKKPWIDLNFSLHADNCDLY
ncbi:unnamed protein product [Musa acuminata subsp. malaccensis]|uniref:(wild Malaysian banana) hypothetical protein n=1 Tax=Musa acuminata subsp. malaccensis TaxID=214687 RepID=A0A804HVX6_MUSAM|nr:PREDICTED: uncharacterized protein LOC103998144 [Musa acuminata subsp. malaccensis]CAG1859981.1 unnamed protein product [Musa acuminata subsp. malaccensis]